MLAGRGWWISPKGKIYLFDVGGRHIYFIKDNPHLFELTPKETKELKLAYDGGSIRGKFIKKALKKNWIRIREHKYNTTFNFNTFNFDTVKRIRKFLKQYKFWDNDQIKLLPIGAREFEFKKITAGWIKSKEAEKEASKNNVTPMIYNK